MGRREIRPHFVIGTGRCGSTLLSRMLAEHRGVLSLFEFFNGLDMERRFEREPISGPEFAEIVGAEQPFVTAVVRRGYSVEEITYPFADASESELQGRAPGRYRRADATPWLCITMLPRLTDSPDALFDELLEKARNQPRQPPRAHYRSLFDWLMGEQGRKVWVERSGSSIDYLDALAAEFPEALFLHIHRDGREVALSMREHHAYRLPISLMYDAPVASGKRLAELPPPDFTAAPRADDTISQILESRPEPFYFGRYWSDQVKRGEAARKAIPASRFKSIRFEDLVSDPKKVLYEIGAFFELPNDPDWIRRGASLVRGRPPLRRGALDARDRRALHAACGEAMALLGREL